MPSNDFNYHYDVLNRGCSYNGNPYQVDRPAPWRQTYAKKVDNGALRSFAAQTLPVLKQHYDEIQQAAAM